MIQSYIQNPAVTLISNSAPLAFQNDCIKTNSASNCNPCGWLCHSEGNPLYKITKGGRYHVEFNANVSSASAGIVAFGLYLDGILLPGASAIATVTADGYVNISIDKEVPICQSGTLTIQAIPTVVTPTTPATPIETQVPIVVSGNLQIRRDN